MPEILTGKALAAKLRKAGIKKAYRPRHAPKDLAIPVSFALYLILADKPAADRLLRALTEDIQVAPGTAKASVYSFQHGDETAWDVQVEWMDNDEAGRAYALGFERAAHGLCLYRFSR